MIGRYPRQLGVVAFIGRVWQRGPQVDGAVWGPGYQVYGTDDRLNAEALRHARAQGGLGGYVHPVSKRDSFADENLSKIPKSLIAGCGR